MLAADDNAVKLDEKMRRLKKMEEAAAPRCKRKSQKKWELLKVCGSFVYLLLWDGNGYHDGVEFLTLHFVSGRTLLIFSINLQATNCRNLGIVSVFLLALGDFNLSHKG
ncbi:unnamed protein product [Arabidopsis arenosa]|uniref:Uncharacterized protein n=1 Tax=Arabidopsis arenosa TaxID=38785 RepID=A0A8S1ZTB8_ARAAE|nr:unnamed protein product [Arabidopsis arenosa]